jgi:hypothetical protein
MDNECVRGWAIIAVLVGMFILSMKLSEFAKRYRETKEYRDFIRDYKEVMVGLFSLLVVVLCICVLTYRIISN